MTLMGGDYTLKSAHLLLVILVTLLVILGYSYLNETSRRIELQQEVLILERQSHSVATDRLAMQKYLKDQLDRKTSEISKLQKIHNFQTEQQSANFWTEKNDLLATISSKEKTIEDMKDQLRIVKEHFEALQSEMQQFQKNQSRLLEKFSIQSTQCMNIISMMKQLCYGSKDQKIRKVSNALKEKETTTASSFAAQQIQDIAMNPHSTNIYKTTQRPGFSFNVTKKNGENKYVSTIAQFDTSTDMFSSLGNSSQEIYQLFKKELQFLKRETDKTKKMEKESVEKLREALANKDYATNTLIQKINSSEDIITQKTEKNEAPGVEANNEVLDQMEEDKMNGPEETSVLNRTTYDYLKVEDNNKWVGGIEEEKKSDITVEKIHDLGKKIIKLGGDGIIDVEDVNKWVSSQEIQKEESTATEKIHGLTKENIMKPETNNTAVDSNSELFGATKYMAIKYLKGHKNVRTEDSIQTQNNGNSQSFQEIHSQKANNPESTQQATDQEKKLNVDSKTTQKPKAYTFVLSTDKKEKVNYVKMIRDEVQIKHVPPQFPQFLKNNISGKWKQMRHR